MRTFFCERAILFGALGVTSSQLHLMDEVIGVVTMGQLMVFTKVLATGSSYLFRGIRVGLFTILVGRFLPS